MKCDLNKQQIIFVLLSKLRQYGRTLERIDIDSFTERRFQDKYDAIEDALMQILSDDNENGEVFCFLCNYGAGCPVSDKQIDDILK